MDNQKDNKNYAYLPDDLLVKILEKVPNTVDKMNRMFDTQEEPIKNGIEELRSTGLINKLSTAEYTSSLIAVDGSNIVEKMTGTDISAFSADFLNYGSKKHRYYRSRRPRQNRFNRCFDEADGNG